MSKLGAQDNLHKTLHYRRIREIVMRISEHEGISDMLNDYDLYKMRAYHTMGDNFHGQNIHYNCIPNNSRYSCFVRSNHYQIIEIPAKSNYNSIEGKFLLLARNTDFDYWIFMEMSYNINKKASKEKKQLVEKMSITPYGIYSITKEINNRIYIEKTSSRSGCALDCQEDEDVKYFDRFSSRKLAYGYNKAEILEKFCGVKNDSNTGIIDNKNVKKYKKKK